MTALEKALTDMAVAFISYAGPLDDPRIGWISVNPTKPDLFRCERCGEEALDNTEIQHKVGCSAKALLDAMNTVKQEIKG